MTRVRVPVRYREAQENMQRIRFVLLVLVAAMLGALISMGDSSPGWDDTGVSDGMVLSASGPQGLGAYGRSPPAAGVGVGAGRRLMDSGLRHYARSRLCLRSGSSVRLGGCLRGSFRWEAAKLGSQQR